MIDKTRMNELADSILWDWESNKKPKHIAQLELVYNNISDDHTRKEDLKKYISYFNEWEDSWISMDEFYSLDKLLKAENAKGGKSDIIVDGSLAEVFIHEALGHSSEADHVMERSHNRMRLTAILDSLKWSLWLAFAFWVEAPRTRFFFQQRSTACALKTLKNQQVSFANRFVTNKERECAEKAPYETRYKAIKLAEHTSATAEITKRIGLQA